MLYFLIYLCKASNSTPNDANNIKLFDYDKVIEKISKI